MREWSRHYLHWLCDDATQTQWNKMQCKAEPDHSEEQSQRELCREVHQCEWCWRLTAAEESPPTRLLTADEMLCWTDREGDRDSWNRVKNTHTAQTTEHYRQQWRWWRIYSAKHLPEQVEDKDPKGNWNGLIWVHLEKWPLNGRSSSSSSSSSKILTKKEQKMSTACTACTCINWSENHLTALLSEVIPSWA